MIQSQFNLSFYICQQGHTISATKIFQITYTFSYNQSAYNTKRKNNLMQIREKLKVQSSSFALQEHHSVQDQGKTIQNWDRNQASGIENKQKTNDLELLGQKDQLPALTELSPDLSSPNEWNLLDLAKLFKLYDFHGPKWIILSGEFDKKSQNVVKNKFYGGLRMFIRRLNSFLKTKKNKYRKKTKDSAIIRILDLSGSCSPLPQSFKKWGSQIRISILKATERILKNEEIQNDDFEWLSENIISFNIETRGYKPKKQGQDQSEQKQTKTKLVSQQNSGVNNKNHMNSEQKQHQGLKQNQTKNLQRDQSASKKMENKIQYNSINSYEPNSSSHFRRILVKQLNFQKEARSITQKRIYSMKFSQNNFRNFNSMIFESDISVIKYTNTSNLNKRKIKFKIFQYLQPKKVKQVLIFLFFYQKLFVLENIKLNAQTNKISKVYQRNTLLILGKTIRSVFFII